jgi:LacI family transcriptional regulator, galactose operon repressor
MRSRDMSPRRQSQVTIADIAREVGFADSTVSRALNDSPLISKETKTRIREVAERLNYRPNLHAQGLARGQSSMIGVLIPDLGGTMLTGVIEGIEEALERVNRRVMLLHSRWDIATEHDHLAFLQSSRIHGAIVCPIRDPEEPKLLAQLQSEGFCTVLVDRYYPEVNLSHVVTDNVRGGRMATEHLMRRKPQRLACLTIPEDEETTATRDRLQGFLATIREAGLPESSVRVIRFDLMAEARQGFPSLQRLVAETPFPEAVFAINDSYALGLHQAMLQRGLTLSDIDLVGFDNVRMLSFVPMPWSAVAQPRHAIGRRAAEILLEMLERGSDHVVRETLDPQLIVR